MKTYPHRLLIAAILAGSLWILPGALAGITVIQNVPDWNQPYDGYLADPNPPTPNPAPPPTWQQGLWHDGNIELGWYLDTNDVDLAKYVMPPDGHLGTWLTDIAPGLSAYGGGAWVDPSSGIQKIGSPNYTTNAWSVNPANLGNSTPWTDFVAAINNGRPTLIDFDIWFPVNPRYDPSYPEVDMFYDWGMPEETMATR